jgi:hypothetical protein
VLASSSGGGLGLTYSIGCPTDETKTGVLMSFKNCQVQYDQIGPIGYSCSSPISPNNCNSFGCETLNCPSPFPYTYPDPSAGLLTCTPNTASNVVLQLCTALDNGNYFSVGCPVVNSGGVTGTDILLNNIISGNNEILNNITKGKNEIRSHFFH